MWKQPVEVWKKTQQQQQQKLPPTPARGYINGHYGYQHMVAAPSSRLKERKKRAGETVNWKKTNR